MFKKTILNNGLKIITVPQKDAMAATVLVLVGAGSKYEEKKTNGISHFLEHLIFKGTKKRPNNLAIAEPLDRVGGIYNAFTSEEYTGYFAKVGAKHFDLALDVISDIYLNSTLSPKEIEKEKGVIIEEINMRYDHPAMYVETLWNKLLYGDQPAGWDIAGTKETVSRISRQQLSDYMENHYVASNTIICVAGRIPENEESLSKIKKYFAKIKPKKPLGKIKTTENQKKPDCILEKKETDQTHLCLGVRAHNLFHPNRFTQDVLAAILGGMMSSRLFIKIREELSLAYYISTGASALTDTGYLVTQAGVDNKKAEKAISAILSEYKKIATQIVPPEELKKAKDNLIGKMTLLLEASDAQASFYGAQEVLEKRSLTPEEIYDKINQVSADDILGLAQHIFRPQKLNLALIGPFDKKAKFLKLLKF